MASPAPTTEGDEHQHDADGRGRAITVGRVAAALVALGIALLWLYALTRPKTEPPDRFDDPAIAEQAEAICAATLVDLASLPPAFEAATAGERADVIDQSNVELQAMVADIHEVPKVTERDNRMMNEWLGDWETYIGNRADYARRLREDPDARFYVSEKASQQITKPIDRFAEDNLMPSCKTPGDVG